MKKIVLLTIVTMALASCKKEQTDTVKPVIQEFTANGSDHFARATAGTTMLITANLTDNEALGQLKIDIHENFDGHSHGKTQAAWDTSVIYTLSGSSQTVAEELNIPAWATAGAYHVIARLIDAAGNEAEFVEIELVLSNGAEPQITITEPDFSVVDHFTHGQSYTLKGTITDNVGLEEVVILLEEASGHAHKTTAEPLYAFDVDLGGTIATWNFETDGNIVIAIPANAVVGDYHFRVIALDSEGNYGVYFAEIHVE